MISRKTIRKFRYIIFMIGLFLQVATALIGTGNTYELIMFAIRLAVWATIPYLIFLVISSLIKNNAAVIGAGLTMIVLDFLAHIQVIFFPQSSTDAIGLLFIPIWVVIVFMPSGLVIGWLSGIFIKKQGGEEK